ncbi:TPR-like protein [Heliocybe sulcata]|uniref:TPR-like protein n=1 Tax=Heliocybe sulcata TaxID=5364 RepID=A0A5C3N1P7_9AGAM|nr:TPR-like protein [Heliocybe sulcata]
MSVLEKTIGQVQRNVTASHLAMTSLRTLPRIPRIICPKSASTTRSVLLSSPAAVQSQRFRGAPASGTRFQQRRYATSTTAHSTATDPAEVEALKCLEQGTQKLEEGDVQGAKDLYKRSIEIKKNASSLFNYGVTCYHLKEFDEAIESWKESIALQPSSPDAHTTSAYIISPAARPDLALHHLHIAASLAPEDAEIAFNLAAVLEACQCSIYLRLSFDPLTSIMRTRFIGGRLEEALAQYKRSKHFGVERAAMHMRNVSAKILGRKMNEASEKQGSETPGSSDVRSNEKP